MVRVGIINVTGYMGAEAARLLHAHPEVELTSVTGRSDVDWIFISKDGKRRQQSHSVRLYTYTELAAMLSRAGLTVRDTWGDYDGRDFSMRSPRMVVLAEKG